MADFDYEKLLNLCKSTDNDVRTDAVTKLQAGFEAGVEIPDPDALISVLKACLRTSNQHLTTATLSALPPLLPLLVARAGLGASSSTNPLASTSSAGANVLDVHTLRQCLTAFLPSGGVIDRLGDRVDRARDKARETLVLLGGYAFRSSPASGSTLGAKGREGKGVETPIQLFERFFKEGALQSKVWRVREQALLVLAQIRRAHHMFPLRPFLPLLVDTLEDSDANVRAQAQLSIPELFTGPGVTDAARADLKSQMTKKGVRKGIMESIMTRLFAAGGSSTPVATSDAGSENGDSYVPTGQPLTNKKAAQTPGSSMKRSVSHSNVEKVSRPASRAAAASPTPGEMSSSSQAVKPVYIASSRDLENEFSSMLKHFEGKETEHNWAPREKAILRVRGMLKGDVHERYAETFLQGLKGGFLEASIKTLLSLRTTVAANTCSLHAELAASLGTAALDTVCEPLYVNLLRMASLTKKIVAQQAQATVTALMFHTSPLARLVLPLLWNMVQDKNVQVRQYGIGHVKTYLEAHGARARHAIESAGGVETLEKCIKRSLADPNPAVRETGRQAFWGFEGIWRDRGRTILEALDNTARKQLEKACPDPEVLNTLSTVAATPQPKKSSVAAAIAASRAKAKAIATAPPSLRHQATSTARTTSSPPAKRAASPSLPPARATSPVNRNASSSSSPPRARIVSGGTLSRSTSSGFVPNREQARQAIPATPPSPTPDPSYRRRLSSPLVASPNGNGTLRRAMQTALPASPPRGPVVLHRVQQHGGPPRESINITGLHATNDDSLLLASNIPIPEDSDSDMEIDTSVNLISFSTPYEMYPPERTVPRARSGASFSPRSSSSRPPLSNALSTGTSSPPAGVPQPMVEDAMRARAEQAESAAERLLELVDPEEENGMPSAVSASLLLRSSHSTSAGAPSAPVPGSPPGFGRGKVVLQPPRTPTSKKAGIMQRAALFQDSPAYKAQAKTSLFDMINGQTHDNVWWRKRMALTNEEAELRTGEAPDRQEELEGYIAALEHGPADVRVVKKLAVFCRANPVNEPISPISPDFSAPLSPSPLFGTGRSGGSLRSEVWKRDKAFERLFSALVEYLDPARNAAELEYGLIVLWEMLEHQAPLLEGKEADIFSVLLRVRYSGHSSVLQATTNFRDALTSRVEPVYGLTTMHASLRTFRELSAPAVTDADIKNGTYAFGLIALGKFLLRLPAEVLEDELPRLRITLTTALTDTSSDSSLVVREAAAASIIAAQLMLRDEAHLFVLLDGLPEDKKNLLAYLFDKHGCRGSASLSEPGQSGMEKLEREMRRLDGRTSIAPPTRSPAASPFVSTSS